MDPRIRKITTIILLTLQTRKTYGIIGYDCGSPLANITTISLLNIEECDSPPQNINKTQKFIQLIQVNEFKSNTM